ncbi:MAG: ferredoxin [Candidatus Babeliales bacterium]
MKKVLIEPGCTTCGLCEFLAPEIFEVTDISHVKKGAPFAEYQKEIKEAAASCPVTVIKYEE